MSSYYQRQDHRHYVSTHPETAQGVARAEGDMDIEMRLAEEQISEAIKRTMYNPCGGEGFTNATDEQRDADLPLSRLATPDAVGWFQYYLLGGGSAYSVTGSGDPYLHQYLPIQPPDYRLDTFTVFETFKNGGEIWRYRGGQMASGKIRGSMGGDKRVLIEGACEFAGERESATLTTPPECLPEEAYRMTSASFSFGKFGQAAVSGLVTRAFTLEHDNKMETRDECDRSGLYVATRDRGDRSDAVKLSYTVLGRKGDATDTFFHAGDEVYWNVTFTNAVANRAWTLGILKAEITAKKEGWETSVNKSAHEFTLVPVRDTTSSGTKLKWPWWSTLQSQRATFAAA